MSLPTFRWLLATNTVICAELFSAVTVTLNTFVVYLVEEVVIRLGDQIVICNTRQFCECFENCETTDGDKEKVDPMLNSNVASVCRTVFWSNGREPVRGMSENEEGHVEDHELKHYSIHDD